MKEPKFEDYVNKNTFGAEVPSKPRDTVQFGGEEPSDNFAKGMLKGLGFKKANSINPETTTKNDSDFYMISMTKGCR